MFEIDAKSCLWENSKRTCENVLFKKEMENCLYLLTIAVTKRIWKVIDTIERLQSKRIKLEQILCNLFRL